MKNTRSFIELNLSILFLSTSGVLGRLIEMTPTLIIWWRCALATVLMFLFVRIVSLDCRVRQRSHYPIIFLSSFLLAAHWVTYFYSLSLSNIAVAMITLHTYPAMTALLEPLILKTRFQWYHLLLALLIVLGVYIMVPPGEVGNQLSLAFMFGLLSALTYALRNIYTRKIIPDYNGSVMMLFQLAVMTVILLPFLFLESTAAIKTEWPYVALLALFTTCFGHTLFVRNLKSYNTTTISLLTSIVPVYGILWGVVFLTEIPSVRMVVGGILVLIAFVIESRRSS